MYSSSFYPSASPDNAMMRFPPRLTWESLRFSNVSFHVVGPYAPAVRCPSCRNSLGSHEDSLAREERVHLCDPFVFPCGMPVRCGNG